MNSEPKYKVLSTVTINGNKVELREYASYWGVAETDTHGKTKEHIRHTYQGAQSLYSHMCTRVAITRHVNT